MEMLKNFNNKNDNPRRIKDEIIPNAVTRKLTLAFCWFIEKIVINLIERIGKTQGIIFKTKPAKSETNIKYNIIFF